MLKSLQKLFGLTPKDSSQGIQADTKLKINVGIVNNKLQINIDRPVSAITFDKNELDQFLAAVASQAGALK